MESEKVKEIKKDIEICMKSLNCNGCSHHSQKSGECCSNLTNDILTYINELESENELLRNAKVVYETVDYCYEDLKKAEKRIAELKKEKTEQLKQFAKGLKDKAIRRQEFIGELAIDDIEYVKTQDIDETLKECIK